MESEMMKSEIMKAFAVCMFHEDECEKCSYFKYEDCTEKLVQDLDNLINRQKAEIERLNNALDTMVLEHQRLMRTAKAEAVKEFAERLREKTKWLFSSVSINNEIDNLLKELEAT